MKNLTKKKVYITGGSSGIGLEAAKLISRQGADVALIARDKDKLYQALKDLEQLKISNEQRFDLLSLDVSDHKAVESKLTSFTEDFGSPDVLVVNAGIGYANYFDQISYEDFDRVMQINVYGVRNVIATMLPFMKKRGGKIVIVSSMAGMVGVLGYTAYGTSKFATIGFAECLRSELKRFKIKLTVFCPAEVRTPLLEEEAKNLPPESILAKKIGGQISAEAAGKALAKATTSNRFLVVPGFMGKASYYINRLLPKPLIRAWLDSLEKLSVKMNQP